MLLSVHHVTEEVILPDDDYDDDVNRVLTEEQQTQRRQMAVDMIAKKMMSLHLTRWDPEQHSIQTEPDSYGTICFDGFGQVASKKAPVSI
jgi:hypothetical protein